MRRRAPEPRRPQRGTFWAWIWSLVVLFLIVGLVLFVFQHHHQVHPQEPIKEWHEKMEETPLMTLNFTEELQSTGSIAQKLVDQMTLAKAYLVVAKERGNLHFAWELSSHIRKCQQLLSGAAVEGKPVSIEASHSIIMGLSLLIYKAQDSHYDISTMLVTLKSHIQALEEYLKAAMVQSAEFGQLASEGVSKILYCLNIKLMTHWMTNPMLHDLHEKQMESPRLVDNNLYHFCIFSDNVLATSVVVNSTVSNAEHPQQFVFHVVTDEVNYDSMRAWFLMSNFRGGLVEVRNIKNLTWLNASYSPLVKQFEDIDLQSLSCSGGSKSPCHEGRLWAPKSAYLLAHLRFYIPKILPTIERVVLLDDDVVVQKDLTPLFSLDLHGNVNGAVETCLQTFDRYYMYLNFSSPLISTKVDPQACSWAFGLNVFDLIEWEKADVTGRYHYWQEQNADQNIWKKGILPPGLLTFYGLIEPLDRRWHVLRLGYDFDIDDRLIESAAVVHFSGNMKPWMTSSIGRYRRIWERYVNTSHPYLVGCSAHRNGLSFTPK